MLEIPIYGANVDLGRKNATIKNWQDKGEMKLEIIPPKNNVAQGRRSSSLISNLLLENNIPGPTGAESADLRSKATHILSKLKILQPSTIPVCSQTLPHLPHQANTEMFCEDKGPPSRDW